MKRFDVKSAAAGFLMGAMFVTSALAVGGGIQSAVFSGAKVTLDGNTVPLKHPLVAVTEEGRGNASMYMPVRELLEYAGYAVTWDGAADTVRITSPNWIVEAARGERVFDLSSRDGSQIVSSGSFKAEDGQVLVLEITSGLKSGGADFFLFDPAGKERRIAIGSESASMEITLSKGVWAYNCTGFWEDGGSLQITGTIKE